MNYLKNYNLTPEQIEHVEQVIKDNHVNLDVFKYDPEDIIAILNLFVNIGVTNLYNIIITRPSLFCDTVESIQNKILKYGNNGELARLLNEDAHNLSLIGLL